MTETVRLHDQVMYCIEISVCPTSPMRWQLWIPWISLAQQTSFGTDEPLRKSVGFSTSHKVLNFTDLVGDRDESKDGRKPEHHKRGVPVEEEQTPGNRKFTAPKELELLSKSESQFIC